MRQEKTGFGDAVAQVGPWSHQHLVTQFLQDGCSSWCSTNSVKAPKILQQVNHVETFSTLATAMPIHISSNFSSQVFSVSAPSSWKSGRHTSTVINFQMPTKNIKSLAVRFRHLVIPCQHLKSRFVIFGTLQISFMSMNMYSLISLHTIMVSS